MAKFWEVLREVEGTTRGIRWDVNEQYNSPYNAIKETPYALYYDKWEAEPVPEQAIPVTRTQFLDAVRGVLKAHYGAEAYEYWLRKAGNYLGRAYDMIALGQTLGILSAEDLTPHTPYEKEK